MFEQIKIILINTTHPGNVGAVARAAKNMGFKQLCLVSPKQFPSKEALDRASGAQDVLSQAVVTNTLEEALKECQWVMGFSARARKVSWPLLTARAAAYETVKRLKQMPTLNVALVFGQEQSGLHNEELAKCHSQVIIPANPFYSSLNLAQAVQIMAYELRVAILETEPEPLQTLKEDLEETLATTEEMEHFYNRLEEILVKVRFLDPQYPGYLMLYLRRLYGKGQVTRVELNILQGMLTAIQKSV